MFTNLDEARLALQRATSKRDAAMASMRAFDEIAEASPVSAIELIRRAYTSASTPPPEGDENILISTFKWGLLRRAIESSIALSTADLLYGVAYYAVHPEQAEWDEFPSTG